MDAYTCKKCGAELEHIGLGKYYCLQCQEIVRDALAEFTDNGGKEDESVQEDQD